MNFRESLCLIGICPQVFEGGLEFVAYTERMQKKWKIRGKKGILKMNIAEANSVNSIYLDKEGTMKKVFID